MQRIQTRRPSRNRKYNLRKIEEKVKEIIASIDPKITVEEETENDYYDNCCEMDDDRNITLISCKIFRAFLQFAQLSRDEQVGAILSDSGKAILLFCSALDSVSKLMFPIVDLELGCRGMVVQRPDGVWNVEIGEIKSSSSSQGLAKANLQLKVRLQVLNEAIKIIHGRSIPAVIRLEMNNRQHLW